MKHFKWENEVRAHEIDVQGIVNNAHYLSYFDHTRTLYLKALGMDWAKLSQEGLNLVLTETTLQFIHPLRAFQFFSVNSEVLPLGKLKLIFKQEIKSADKLICKATSKVVCVDSIRNKPISLNKICSLVYRN